MKQASFLPEDYLAEKAERRTNLICLSLFAIVMSAVFGAFLVTNRQWTQVKAEQQRINAEYQEAASMIQELHDLEVQKAQMLDKAELAASLVERVPRSILLAELINRMPPRLGFFEFELTSELLRPSRAGTSRNDATGRIRSGGSQRGRTVDQAAQEDGLKIDPPRYTVNVRLVGAAPTDLEVSSFLKELSVYNLFRDVNLVRSEGITIDDRSMREFAITFRLDPRSDVRDIEPRLRPRHHSSPFDDQMIIAPQDRSAGGVLRNPYD